MLTSKICKYEQYKVVFKIIACLIFTVWRKIVIPIYTLTQLNQQYTSVYTKTKCYPVPIALI